MLRDGSVSTDVQSLDSPWLLACSLYIGAQMLTLDIKNI